MSLPLLDRKYVEKEGNEKKGCEYEMTLVSYINLLPSIATYKEREIKSSGPKSKLKRLEINGKLLVLEIAVIKIQTCFRRYLAEEKVIRMRYIAHQIEIMSNSFMPQILEEAVLQACLEIPLVFFRTRERHNRMLSIVNNLIMSEAHMLLEEGIVESANEICKEVVRQSVDIYLNARHLAKRQIEEANAQSEAKRPPTPVIEELPEENRPNILLLLIQDIGAEIADELIPGVVLESVKEEVDMQMMYGLSEYIYDQILQEILMTTAPEFYSLPEFDAIQIPLSKAQIDNEYDEHDSEIRSKPTEQAQAQDEEKGKQQQQQQQQQQEEEEQATILQAPVLVPIPEEVTPPAKTSPAVQDPIKDDGFCGYHCWSYYLSDLYQDTDHCSNSIDKDQPSRMRAFLMGIPDVREAVADLYGETCTPENFLTASEPFRKGHRYPFTPLIRYLDLKKNHIMEGINLDGSTKSASHHHSLVELIQMDQQFKEIFLQSGSGGDFSAAQELLAVANLQHESLSQLFVQDMGNSGKGARSGNPLWATDSTHVMMADLTKTNVNIILCGQSDRDAGGEDFEYEMTSHPEHNNNVRLFFNTRHYTVVPPVLA